MEASSTVDWPSAERAPLGLAAISVRSVTKRFGRVTAVEDLTERADDARCLYDRRSPGSFPGAGDSRLDMPPTNPPRIVPKIVPPSTKPQNA
jgi:hypothetical protein